METDSRKLITQSSITFTTFFLHFPQTLISWQKSWSLSANQARSSWGKSAVIQWVGFSFKGALLTLEILRGNLYLSKVWLLLNDIHSCNMCGWNILDSPNILIVCNIVCCYPSFCRQEIMCHQCHHSQEQIWLNISLELIQKVFLQTSPYSNNIWNVPGHVGAALHVNSFSFMEFNFSNCSQS